MDTQDLEYAQYAHDAAKSVLNAAERLAILLGADPRIVIASVSASVIKIILDAMDREDAEAYLRMVRRAINSDLMDAQTPTH